MRFIYAFLLIIVVLAISACTWCMILCDGFREMALLGIIMLLLSFVVCPLLDKLSNS